MGFQTTVPSQGDWRDTKKDEWRGALARINFLITFFPPEVLDGQCEKYSPQIKGERGERHP